MIDGNTWRYGVRSSRYPVGGSICGLWGALSLEFDEPIPLRDSIHLGQFQSFSNLKSHEISWSIGPCCPGFPFASRIDISIQYIYYTYYNMMIYTYRQRSSSNCFRVICEILATVAARNVGTTCLKMGYGGIPWYTNTSCHFLGKWWSAIKFQCTLFSDKPMWKIVGWMECIATKIMGQSRGPKILAIRGYNLYTFHPASIPLQGSSTMEQNKCIVNTWHIANYHPESKHFTLLQTKIDVENTPYL